MYLSGILDVSHSCSVRDSTYCHEGWVQPRSRLYPIKDLNISKASNEFPKPDLGDDSWLYNFEDVYPIYKKSRVQPVVAKCNVVEDLIFYVNKFSNKSWGKVIHKLELKDYQAIQSSEGRQLTNSNKYHSNRAFGIQVSIHTPGPVLLGMHKQDSTIVFMGHTSC